jgi:hypothetical protein
MNSNVHVNNLVQNTFASYFEELSTKGMIRGKFLELSFVWKTKNQNLIASNIVFAITNIIHIVKPKKCKWPYKMVLAN